MKIFGREFKTKAQLEEELVFLKAQLEIEKARKFLEKSRADRMKNELNRVSVNHG